eukprot:3670332-Pleurochrysis_carterae.AAC.1
MNGSTTLLPTASHAYTCSQIRPLVPFTFGSKEHERRVERVSSTPRNRRRAVETAVTPCPEAL